MSAEDPVTEDDVAADFVDAIDVRLFDRALGWTRPLELYSWPDGSGDDGWPFVVVRDGREFEVDIQVQATELTPERLAQRDEAERQILVRLAGLPKDGTDPKFNPTGSKRDGRRDDHDRG